MTARPVLVFCEGPHDIAYLTRLLAASGAVAYNVVVSKLEWPFGKLFTDRYASRNANNAKLCGRGAVLLDEPPLLEAVWKLPDDSRHWYFLNCCGDGREGQINAILKLVTTLTQTAEPKNRLSDLGIVFVNDADEMGIKVRQQQIAGNHAEILFPLVPHFAGSLANSVQHNVGLNYGVGTCIFFESGTDKGTLESIVWPLMRSAASPRHDQSHDLMDQFAMAGTNIGPGNPASKKLKAALTAAGQPESPGCSLAVIPRESLHLTAAALKADPISMCYLNVLMEA